MDEKIIKRVRDRYRLEHDIDLQGVCAAAERSLVRGEPECPRCAKLEAENRRLRRPPTTSAADTKEELFDVGQFAGVPLKVKHSLGPGIVEIRGNGRTIMQLVNEMEKEGSDD